MDIKGNLSKKDSALWGMALFILLIITYLIYSAGISGIFIFDDLHNISPIGKYKNLSGWDNFWLFVLEGGSGPTGRPISLASFYLNDIAWPSQPAGFITTNILIHLLNGALVFWFSLKLSKTLGLTEKQQAFFSLLSTAFWLLNPMQTTTVVYIVQRMTELSATFTLAGMIFYLYGREKLFINQKTGFLILFLGVGGSLLLAIFSKENGILLVGYILTIEFFLLRPFKLTPPRGFSFWFIPTIIIPFIIVFIYLGFRIDSDYFINRNFTLTERLLTQPRILFDYLHSILLPNMGAISLYHDNYEISRSLFSPWTTFISIAGIIFFIVLAFILRKKQPLITFSIIWFFTGHLLESTVLSLELYFEHRNYLPILGISILISWYVMAYIKTHKIITSVFIVTILCFNTAVVFQNATLWGKPLELATNWYIENPESSRTREYYRVVTRAYGVKPELITQKDNKIKTDDQFYSNLILADLTNKCLANKTTKEILDSIIYELKKNKIHPSATAELVKFISYWKEGKCKNIDINTLEDFLLQLTSIEKIQNVKIFSYFLHYSLAEVYLIKKDFNKSIKHLENAYNYDPNTQILTLRASYFVSAGLYKEALEVLADTSQLEKGLRAKIVMKIKQKELDKLRLKILKKINS